MDRLRLFEIGFLPITVIDVIDILAVTYIFYKLFMMIRGTRAAQMILGLLVVFVASVVAQNPWRRMNALSWLLSNVQTVLVFALIIIFQPELRRMLVRLGQSRIVRFLYKMERSRVVDAVVDAAMTLSERGHGALMVLVRDVGVASIIETGVPLNAEVSADLVTAIFTPRSPLHDQALIIQGETIIAARCTLPLSDLPDIDPSLGTRHRAALGLSEESDAVVIVVSEETQAISIAVDGKLMRNLEPSDLRATLTTLMGAGVRSVLQSS